MDKAGAIKILKKFHQALKNRSIPVREMILFGSYATGRQTEGSDIDVVVISDKFQGLNHWERIEVMADALYEVFEPIETRAVTPEEWDSKESFVWHYANAGEHLTV